MEHFKKNPYLKMDIRRVVEDARVGVSLARQAWRERQPEAAAAALGQVVESQHRIAARQ